MPPELTKVCNQIDVGELLKHPDFAGAADKAVNLVGCKSPRHQLPGIGSLACPMPAEETKQVLLGCKTSAALRRVVVAVGTIWQGQTIFLSVLGPERAELPLVE